LIDVGSTTTDLIPLTDGVPVPIGLTDPDRLAAGELVYTGARRTPVCAIVSHVPYRGQELPVAAELFATTQDAYLMLGEIPEDPDDHGTADTRPATRGAALERLARVVCADRELFSHQDALAMAEHVRAAQDAQLLRALEAVVARTSGRLSRIVIAGEGEFLSRRLADRAPGKPPIVTLADELSPEVSRCACAYALAVLADELAGEQP
jgi:probable H4MPT-linked C1 transfer pathway protein